MSSIAENLSHQELSLGSDNTRLPPPEWLNVQFIERALKKEETESKITCLQAYYANPPGENYASEMFKVRVNVIHNEDKQKNIYLIVKCLARTGLIVNLIRENCVFNNEGIMLQEIIVSMNKLLERLQDFEPFCAKCYLNTNEPTEILVLEDLTQSGFSMAKRLQGLDLPHSLLVMRTIAKFHATSAVLYQRNPKLFKLFGTHPIWKESTRSILNPLFTGGLATLIPKVKEWTEFPEESDKILEQISIKLYDRIMEIFKSETGHFRSLIHGDFWINNMMFNYCGEHVTSMRLVDLQMSHINCPSMDLLYFIETSINNDVYQNNMEKLICEYHNTLTETLQLLNYRGELYTMQDLKKDLHDHAWYALFALLSALPIILARPEDKFNMDDSIIRTGDDKAAIYLNPSYLAIVRYRLPNLLKQISLTMK